MLIKNKCEDYFNSYDKDKRQNDLHSINNNILYDIYDNNDDIIDHGINRNHKNKYYDYDLYNDNKLDDQEIKEGANFHLDKANQFINNFDLNGNGLLEPNEFGFI